MKKNLFIIICIVVIVLVVLSILFYNINVEKNKKDDINGEIEAYTKDRIFGTNLISLINKVDDLDKKNAIIVDGNGRYVENDFNSVRIDVRFQPVNQLGSDKNKDMTTISFENIVKGTPEAFISVYATSEFKCVQKDYHSNGVIKYLLFEEVKVDMGAYANQVIENEMNYLNAQEQIEY